jgi:hypothetical protein
MVDAAEQLLPIEDFVASAASEAVEEPFEFPSADGKPL